MNKQYIIDNTPVWLEQDKTHITHPDCLPLGSNGRHEAAISLANHLCNNWDQTHPAQVEWGCMVCGHTQHYTLLIDQSDWTYVPYCEMCGQYNTERASDM